MSQNISENATVNVPEINVPEINVTVPDASVPEIKQAVKFTGKYAGIETDCFIFLTQRCGVSEKIAIKVANDAASSIGRVMVGVNTQVSFGRMSKDALADIRETSTRKGISVNEFPLQVAYLAEKTRKFCFDNKVKVASIELPENLSNYLRDLQG